ncbi:MAG: hypothetical protein J6E32_03365 [Lachnospiraceae bacterium]|nr:hypothetical protein [Lachnospiraceae bacterium]
MTMIINGIRTFVKSFYECYESVYSYMEDDQKLPEVKTLEYICTTLLNVSTMCEESRYPSFRVCFIPPDSELLAAYIYSHTLMFETPFPFTENTLNKLAPALNPDISYLMLDIRSGEFKVIGILSAFTIWEKILTREVATGNRLPRIPNIFVKNPGELEACIGEASVVSYRSGNTVFFRTNTFTSTLAAAQLSNGSHVSDDHRLKFIYRILWRIRQNRNGALIFIVPSEESCSEYLKIKYKLPIRFLFSSDDITIKHTANNKAKELVTYAELIAKFTSVDGAVVLTKDLDLLGFGAETLVDNVSGKHPRMCFIDWDGKEDLNKSFDDNGMRHRACYYLCDKVDASVGIVVSQDGIIKCCTRNDGKVMVYDYVSLPFL